MANQGEFLGNDVKLAYNSTGSTWVELDIFTNDDSMSMSAGEAETTSHGTVNRTYMAGLLDGEYSFTVKFNEDATLTTAGKPQDLLRALFKSRATKPWRVRERGVGATKPEALFNAFISSFEINYANDDDPVSADVTLKISGAVTDAVQS